jgi:hypothetical protein
VQVHRIDHVGIIVKDLAAAKAFFLDFGLELQGEAELEGEWLDKIVGLNNVKVALAMLRTPIMREYVRIYPFNSATNI